MLLPNMSFLSRLSSGPYFKDIHIVSSAVSRSVRAHACIQSIHFWFVACEHLAEPCGKVFTNQVSAKQVQIRWQVSYSQPMRSSALSYIGKNKDLLNFI